LRGSGGGEVVGKGELGEVAIISSGYTTKEVGSHPKSGKNRWNRPKL